MEPLPDFESAVDEFARFIGDEHNPMPIRWAFREDLIWCNMTVHVICPLPSQNTRLVRNLYESDAAQQIGMLFYVLVFLDDWACCSVWVPRNREEAADRLLSGVKLSYPDNPPRGRETKSVVAQKVLRFLEKRSRWPSYTEDVISRNAPPLSGAAQ